MESLGKDLNQGPPNSSSAENKEGDQMINKLKNPWLVKLSSNLNSGTQLKQNINQWINYG